jgi:hypothetical protein
MWLIFMDCLTWRQRLYNTQKHQKLPARQHGITTLQTWNFKEICHTCYQNSILCISEWVSDQQHVTCSMLIKMLIVTRTIYQDTLWQSSPHIVTPFVQILSFTSSNEHETKNGYSIVTKAWTILIEKFLFEFRNSYASTNSLQLWGEHQNFQLKTPVLSSLQHLCNLMNSVQR